jgi:hypothetical protein
MSKKNILSKGIEGLLKGNETINTDDRNLTQNSSKPTDLETKTTQLVKVETLEKIKNIAYWERSKIKDVFEDAFQDYIKKYETLNGEIKNRK